MDERVLRKSLLWSVIIILVAVLGIAVTPSLAIEPSYTLQQLFDKSNPIQIRIDNLIFENFVEKSNDIHEKSLYEKISVEKVGVGTLNPGLKFIPDPDSSPAIWSLTAIGTRELEFSYEVNTVGSTWITGSSLTLEPGIVEPPSSGYARAEVRDYGTGIFYDNLEVRQDSYLLSSSGPEVVEDALEATAAFSGQATRFQDIEVRLQVGGDGGQASIEAFEQRFWLDPSSERPVANAGSDQVVLDSVTLNCIGCSPVDAEVQWELYPKDGVQLEPIGTSNEESATFSDLANGFYQAKLTVTSEGVSAVDFVNIAAAGPAQLPEQQADADLKVWGLKLKKYKRCKWSFARMYGTFDFPDVDLDHNGTVNAEVTIKILGAKPNGEDFLVKGETACKVRDHKYKFVIRK
ncbi:MAG: hypothetical protein JSV47_04050 [Deltaproteobacteria bacterium]|nr:MAG: hypothetical protein JSV47_04050 [Deltaproteobacteria bacterium]